MATGFFVTGTDTGAGKTAVGCAILAALRARGAQVSAFKPFETDCEPSAAGGWLPGADAHALARAARLPVEAVVGQCLPEALAPSESARLAGQKVQVDSAIQQIRRRLQTPGYALVEGAGGLLVPLDPPLTWLELLDSTQLPVLLVAGNRLGVLNHTLLSVLALRTRSIPLLGVALNEVEQGPPDAARQSNLRVLREMLPGVPVVAVPRMDLQDAFSLAHAGEPVVAALLDEGKAQDELGSR